jgi:hypothetical protein
VVLKKFIVHFWGIVNEKATDNKRLFFKPKGIYFDFFGSLKMRWALEDYK